MKETEFNIFKVKRPNIKPSKGRVLIADPFLKGPYFSRSIVLITEYGKQGAVGFVLNKTSHIYPDEVIDDILSFKGELYLGGPVSTDTLHFIHTLGEELPGAVQITDKLYWGGDFDALKDLINANKVNDTQVKFFAGYSGWSAGQLEKELEENSWILTNLEDDGIMSRDVDRFWKDSLSKLGDTYKTWSSFPEDPTHN